MLHRCDRCESPATVHLTELRGGAKTESHLCEDCARVLHAPQPSKELEKLIKSFEPKFSMDSPEGGAEARACPECGMTYAEFRQHGRFGCAHDYEAFGTEVTRLLERIHGSSEYTGPSPDGGMVERGQLLDEVTMARARLDVAVQQEDYEEAARLRDEIRRLQESSEGKATDQC